MASTELESVIAMLRTYPIGDSLNLDVAAMRAAMEQMTGMMPPQPGLIREPVLANGVPAEWVSAPGAVADRAVLYLHGGGYVIGSIGTHRDLAGRISAASGARCLVIDYRLGPEHPFPAAVDDAVAAHRWLIGAGFQPGKLAIAGDPGSI